MRIPFLFVVAALAVSLARGAESSGDWRALPLVKDGKVAPEWVHIGYGGWAVEDGAIRTVPAAEGLGLLVYKKERLGNCQIRLIFKAKEQNSNSGFYVRIADGILDQVKKPGAAFERDASGKASDASTEKVKTSADREEGPWFAVHQGYEVQIAGNSTGSIYSLAPTAVKSPDIAGKWRTMIVTLAGERIEVELDGKRAASVDVTASNLPTRKNWHEPKRDAQRTQIGYVGLQTHDPGDIVSFREISVRPLPRETK